NCSSSTSTTASNSASTRRPTSWRTYNTSGDDPSTSRRSWTTSRPCCPSTAPTTASEPEERSMTLDELLLQRLAEPGPAGGRQEMRVSDDAGRSVALVADHVDTVGCRLDEVVLGGPAPADLPARAAALAARVTGLLEPLRVLETDPEAGVAVLRSTSPARRGEAR